MDRASKRPYSRPELVEHGSAVVQTQAGPPVMPEAVPPFDLDEIKVAD